MTTERERFEAAHKHLSLDKVDSEWTGSPTYVHSHVDAMWAGWQAALTAPPGYVMVPVEPTPEMVAAIPYPLSVTPNTGIQCYRAMLAAASAKEPT